MPARATAIDGKALAEARQERLRERVAALAAVGRRPCLAAVTVVDEPGWRVYQGGQRKRCEALGVQYRPVALPAGAAQADLLECIESLNAEAEVHGVIIQAPLPAPFDLFQAQSLLAPSRDVEGVNPANLGLLMAGRGGIVPCTARSAVALAEAALGDLRGVEACVIGASVIVGKPVMELLVNAGATPRLCHILTRDVAACSRAADLVIVAVGKAGLLQADMVRPGAVVIDVGINRVRGDDGKMRTVGDVAEAVWEVAGQVSPVPGGVGALTTSYLLEHTIAACERPTAERPAIEGAALARILGPVASELSPELADRLAGLLNRHLVTGDLSDRRSVLERRLQRGVVIMDGAMGSELIAAGVAPAAVAAANLDLPDLVTATHRRYVEAGAEVLLTNTFALNRYQVPDRQRCQALIQAGVRLARQVASGQVLVLGSIGPLPGIIDADLSRAEAVEAFAEIALAMADAGVDGFCCETMPSTAHAAAALAGVRRASGLPVVVSRAYPAADADELQEFAEAMAVGGALAVGLNCVGGPSALLPAVRELAARSSLPVLARPNAGSPRLVEGRPRYQLRPEWMARQAEAYRQAGVALIGGCCGVGPEHIGAVAGRCAGQPRVAPSSPASVVAGAAPSDRSADGVGLETGFITCALLPGGLPPQAMLAAGAALAGAGLERLGIDPSWPGSPAPGDLPSRLRHLGDAVDRPLVCSLSAGSVTVQQAEAVLWSAHLLGIDQVLIDCGSFCSTVTAGGIDGEELVRLVERMNRGRDAAGNRLPEATRLRVIVRLSSEELAGAERWRELGVDAISLQPVYSPRRFRVAIESYDAGLPLLAEVLVLPDAPTAEALDNEVPALQVPRRLIDRLAEDPAEDQRGVLRFLAAWQGRLAGVYLLLPDARTAAAVAVLQGLRGASPTTL